MRKFFYLISLLVLVFYYLNPLYENKRLDLSLNQTLYLSDSGDYIIFDKISERYLYINLLTKYKNNWIGNILTCDDSLSNYYERTDEETLFISLIEEADCNFYEEKKGYFLINDKGDIKYNLELKEFNEEINLKNPSYYIKRFGKEKGINNIYFSGDSTVSMFQKPSEVKKRVYLIRNILYLIFVFPSVIFVIKDLKRAKKS